jgi:alkanesulfonate monooxygenase SsuD/methylene tetrahydromethanopterin reductase-like flavin-dependent oxidoreductase (luciferase family)
MKPGTWVFRSAQLSHLSWREDGVLSRDLKENEAELKIAIGLPNPIPGVSGARVVDWAQRAEGAGFSTLATIDRIVFPSFDSLTSLAAAAAVTESIGLMTNILIGPTRNAVLLAKEAASVDRLSDGRLVLGLAPGGRDDDFEATGQDFSSRGKRFDDDLELMHEVWDGALLSETKQPSVPMPGKPVSVMIGGTTEQAVRRTVRWGEGWTAGGAGPEAAGEFGRRVRAAWSKAGKPGEPRIAALSYFALGPGADEGARAYIGDYYGFLGEWAGRIADSVPKDFDAVLKAAKRFEDEGIDEVVFDPTIAELDQIDRLAEVVI